MNTLRESLRDYLAMRRDLGFKLQAEGTSLLSFLAFMETAQADHISTDLALGWATQPTSVQPARWARRLSHVRAFARYCSAIDPRTEVPPAGLLPFQYRRPTPYFFADQDIERLLQGALRWPAKDGLENHTLYCLFGLLAVSGLRIGEALRLVLDDVDLDDGILTIRSTKFNSSRLIPLHSTTVSRLSEYREHREQCLSGRQFSHLFVSSCGSQLDYGRVRYAFRRLTAQMRDQPGRTRPRLHALRHHFAVMTLLRWYRLGKDVEPLLPTLSAFLGHVQVSDTYWYLSAYPELLDAAKDRLERHAEQLP